MGYTDYYTGVVKGALYNLLPNVQLIDLTHRLTLDDGIIPAAFVLRNSYRMFPPSTIHVMAVNTRLDFNSRHVVFMHEGYFFVGTDNGVFSLAFDTEPEEVYDISHHRGADGPFPVLEVFVPAVARLANGEQPSDLGLPIPEGLIKKVMQRPTLDANQILGTVIYSDHYGNAITNISKEMYLNVSQGRKPNITIRPMGYKVEFGKNYHDVNSGDIIALFNSMGMLEIAMSNGNLLKLVRVGVSAQIKVEFKGS